MVGGKRQKGLRDGVGGEGDETPNCVVGSLLLCCGDLAGLLRRLKARVCQDGTGTGTADASKQLGRQRLHPNPKLSPVARSQE
jgi:hypothetical protein